MGAAQRRVPEAAKLSIREWLRTDSGDPGRRVRVVGAASGEGVLEPGFPVVDEREGGEFGEEEARGEENEKGEQHVDAEVIGEGEIAVIVRVPGQDGGLDTEELRPRAHRDEENHSSREEHREDAMPDEGGGKYGDAVDDTELGDDPEGLEFGFPGNFGDADCLSSAP
jgi:hypothetical protein